MKITIKQLENIVRESIERIEEEIVLRRDIAKIDKSIVKFLAKERSLRDDIYGVKIDDLIKAEIAPSDLIVKKGDDYYDYVNDVLDRIKDDQKELSEGRTEQTKAMQHPNKLGAGAKKRKKLSSKKDKFETVMREFAKGTLHSGDGSIVKDRKQALAIAYSESKLDESATLKENLEELSPESKYVVDHFISKKVQTTILKKSDKLEKQLNGIQSAIDSGYLRTTKLLDGSVRLSATMKLLDLYKFNESVVLGENSSDIYTIDDDFYLYKNGKKEYCSNSKKDLVRYLEKYKPELLTKLGFEPTKTKEYSGVITLYLGYGYNEGNNFYSPSKEFALEFTRTGDESELKKVKVNTNRIFKNNPLPRGYGVEDENFDKTIELAKSKGFNAMWVDEGENQPNSVFKINPNKPF